MAVARGHGRKAAARPKEIKRRGHAIEARLYAEDATAGFLPSTGEITHWRMPREGHDLRIDTGFGPGDTVSQYYDPMLAKLIARGATRESALARLKGALSSIEIAGVATNAPFLARLLGEEAVAKNAVDTGYIERERVGLSDGSVTILAFHLASGHALLFFMPKRNVHAAMPPIRIHRGRRPARGGCPAAASAISNSAIRQARRMGRCCSKAGAA